MIYHITTLNDWQNAQHAGGYRPPAFESEGFIHCSYAEQVARTARHYFAGQTGLALLHIDESKLTAELRAEPGADTPQLFPHLYGPLNLDAVVEVTPLDPSAPTLDGPIDTAV